jgi:hypothetical protein
MSSEPEFNELEHSLEDLQISGSLDKASYTCLIKKLISGRLENILDNINIILKSKGKSGKKNLGRWERELRAIREKFAFINLGCPGHNESCQHMGKR